MILSRSSLMAFSSMCIFTLAGCVAVRPDERFGDVRSAVVERLGPAASRVHWRLGGPEDADADGFVSGLLAQPLTADAAVQVALLRSRELQAVYEDLGVAQADLVHAGLLRNPDLAGFFRIPDRGPSGVNWNVGLDLWLDVFLVPLRKRIAGNDLDAALLRVTDAVLDKATRVRVAWHRLAADQRVVEHQRALADFAATARDIAEQQFPLGHIPEIELARERLAAEEAAIALDQAESAARVSREELGRLLDLTDGLTPWSIAASDDPVPSGDPDVDEMVTTAVDRRLDLALLAREVEQQRLGLELDRKWFLAKGSVGVETERSSEGVQATGPHFSVELPIFHQHQAVYARREALIRQAEERLASRRGAARAEVRTAAERMALARRSLARYERVILPERRKVGQLALAEHNAMITGYPELLAAKSAEARSAIDAARAQQDYWTARAELERAMGVRVPEHAESVAVPPAGVPSQPTPTAMPDMPGMKHP